MPSHAEGFGPVRQGPSPPVGLLDGAADRRLDEREAFAQEVVGQVPRSGMGRDAPDVLDVKPLGHAHRAEEMKIVGHDAYARVIVINECTRVLQVLDGGLRRVNIRSF